MTDADNSLADFLAERCGSLRAALNLVVNCSRALVIAHFDTAESWTRTRGNRPFFGAAHAQLARRLEIEQVSDSEWQIFLELCRRFSQGARLGEGSQAINILGMRNPHGKFSNSRPGVFMVVDSLLSEVIPRTVLTDWYRANLCGRYQIVDSREFIIFAQEWIARFNEINVGNYDREALLALVGPGRLSRILVDIDSEQMTHTREWAGGLIEALEFLAILQFTEKNFRGYRIRFKADPAFVMANLFGRSTGTEGLDYLFYGGLWIPGGAHSRENLSIVISGAPGMGKSTLALGMGVQVAARNGACLFLRFEPDESTILRQMAQYYHTLSPFFRIVSHKRPDSWKPPLDGQRSDAGGLMVISDISTAPVEEIKNTALRLANSLASGATAKSFSERMVVFDSISSAQGYGEDPAMWRNFLYETTKVLRALGYVVVYLVEREKGTEVNFEDYVVDLDIRLIRRESPNFPYPFRTLEISKSRWQASHRGQHVYSIEADIGMRVAPSSPAVLSARRRREARLRYEGHRLVDPGVTNFADYLGGSKARRALHDGRVPWWKQGSVTALLGPRGTNKKPFARAFCETLDKDAGATACALSLHFADEFQLITQDFRRRTQRPNPFGVRYDVPLQTSGKDGLASTLTRVLFRSGYLAPGHVLQTVRDMILEKRKTQTPIRRAVISDAGNIAPNFPALKEDPVFIPALCELLTSEGITTVLLYSSHEGDAYDPILDQVRGAAENLIKFEPISYAGRAFASISVQRSSDSSHDHGVYELRVSWNGGPREELEVLPTFDLVVDLHTDNPKAAKVKITLDTGTALQNQYNSVIKQLHQGIGAYDVQVLDRTVAFARQGIAQHTLAAERTLWIVQLDAYELPLELDSTEEQRSVLCDLSALQKVKRIEKELAFVPWKQGPRQFGGDGDASAVISVPYYLNPSFLVVRTEFRDFALDHQRWRKIGEGLGEYTWLELMQAATEFCRSNSRWQDYTVFDCVAETSETLNCLFLEILASLSGGQLNEERFSESFGPDSRFRTAERDYLQEAALIFRDLLKESFKGYHPFLPKQPATQVANGSQADAPPDSVRLHTTTQAIIWRHWYTSYRQMAADMSGGDCSANPGLSLLRLPGNIWTNGDWHIGILKGSMGVREGINIILDRFVNMPTCMVMLAQGVGLPPFKDFYSGEGDLPVSAISPRWFTPYVNGERVIYRSMMKGYRRIAPILSSSLASILSIKTEDEARLSEIISERLFSMHEIIKKVVPVPAR